MEKEFIPYEQALALKELGFDEPCLTYYEEDKYLKQVFVLQYNKFELFSYKNVMFDNDGTKEIAAPLYQQAFRWFRENYGYDVSIKKRKFEIEKLEIYGESDPDYYFTNFPFDSYEESELKCLKKLIEIVKRKNK